MVAELRSFILCLMVTIALTACRSSQGEFNLAGSTSMQPVAELLVEAYARNGGSRISVQGGGSTAGVQAVLSGVAAVGMISRELNPAESEKGLVAHIIGHDVLTVVVHPSQPLRGLTQEELKALFGGLVTDWRAVGGRPGPVHLVSREAGSGSREAFRSLVGPISPRAIIQGSSGAIRVAVMADPGAIGYVSLGVARMGGLRPLRIDGRPPGAPNYALTRPLSLVTAGEPSAEAAAFLRFVRGAQGRRLIAEEGLVPVK